MCPASVLLSSDSDWSGSGRCDSALVNEIKGCLPGLLRSYLSGKIELSVGCESTLFLLCAFSCEDDEDVVACRSHPHSMRADSRLAE